MLQPPQPAEPAEEAIEFIDVGVHPRYYFANQVVTIRNRHDFVRNLSKARYSDATAFITAPSFVPANGVVRGLRETANTATIDVQASGKAYLVMSVTPNKYWRVTIDGKRVETLITTSASGRGRSRRRAPREMRYRNHLAANG